MKDRLIVALDVNSLKKAKALVDRLYPTVKIFKVGSELFTAAGPDAVKMIHKKGAKVFLDLKFHDIPNTVAKAVKVAKKMGVFMLNVHAFGGENMLKAAISARGKSRKPLILAVTVLTSLDAKELYTIGIDRSLLLQAQRLAMIAKSARLDGVVCSPQEITAIRKACGDRFIIVTPGIRPAKEKMADQRRVATPEYALSCGADYIVIGRPIISSKNPLRSAKSILEKIPSF